METYDRVLAWHKASELTESELEQITGGTSKLTASATSKITDTAPGGLDFTVDQIWD